METYKCLWKFPLTKVGNTKDTLLWLAFINYQFTMDVLLVNAKYSTRLKPMFIKCLFVQQLKSTVATYYVGKNEEA